MRLLPFLLLTFLTHALARRRVLRPRQRSPRQLFAAADLPKQHATGALPADFVATLPGVGLPPNVDAQYAGYLPVFEDSLRNNGSLFFWYFEAQAHADKPLVLWINGGPGCSSMSDGLWAELGPYRADANGAVSVNPTAWTNVANVLFVDQPVGTGFSFAVDEVYAESEQEVDTMFLAWLARWLEVFAPNGRRIILSGESYAGIYLPSFATAILDRMPQVTLEGIAIGNGWTDAAIQSATYATFAYGVGLIGASQYRVLDAQSQVCLAEARAYDPANAEDTWPTTCDEVFNSIFAASGSPPNNSVNVYDVRLYDPTGGDVYPTPAVNAVAYLNQTAIRSALHVPAGVQSFAECSDPVYDALADDAYISTVGLLPGLIAATRVLLYNGQFDFICNHLGTSEYLENLAMSSPQQAELLTADRVQWQHAPGVTAGYAKTAGNLTFLLALGGGHMYPYDQGAAALDMITRFMEGRSFESAFEPISGSAPSSPPHHSPVTVSLTVAIVSVVAAMVLGCLAMLFARWVLRKPPVPEGTKYSALEPPPPGGVPSSPREGDYGSVGVELK